MKDKQDNNIISSALKKDADAAPTTPGCYIMRDEADKIMYIGKAKNLRARIRNYINESDSRYSVKFLMRRVASIEYIRVSSEKEALLLENTLIKAHKPRYNVRLRDDKTYVSLRLDPTENFPRLTVVRRRKKDKARYFGPYHDTRAARETIKRLQKLVPLRVCSNHVLANRTRPCIYYQIKQCHAPCVGLISKEDYAALVQQALLILEGRSGDLQEQLLKEMNTLSDALRFEEAAVVRDRLRDLHTTMEPQRSVVHGRRARDRDVFGYYAEGNYLQLHVLYYRNNAMVGGKSFAFDRIEAPLPELLSSFLLQYYESTPFIPSEILVPIDLEERSILAEIISEQRGAPTTLRVPKQGVLIGLVELASDNARQAFIERKGHEKAIQNTLEEIQQTLHLPVLPNRIECFDISTIQGDTTVAAMVVFERGVPVKSCYRHYMIRSIEGQDDYASMREVIFRRYSKISRQEDLPDLVLIDGGKGQLNVAHTVLKDLGFDRLACISIAEARSGKNNSASFERFFIPGRSNPIIPKQNSSVVRLLSIVRNEAHRFAITYHRKKRSKTRITSVLTTIPGIGSKRARQLLSAFGSVAEIKKASVEQLAAVPSISRNLAQIIHDALA